MYYLIISMVNDKADTMLNVSNADTSDNKCAFKTSIEKNSTYLVEVDF